MSFKKLILTTALLILINLLLIRVVVASPDYYDIKLKVLPEQILNNTEALIFGYIELTDWDQVLPSSDLSISILKNSELIAEYGINDINYYNDLGRSDLLVDGFFYKKMKLEPGNYNALIKIGGITKAYEYFTVNIGNSSLSLNLIDVAQTSSAISPIININNTGTSDYVDIRFFGRNNFDSPHTISVYVTNTQIYSLPESIGTFDSSIFSEPSKVYGLVALSNGSPGFSNASVKVLNVQSLVPNNGTISASIDSIKMNTNAQFAVSINNTGLIKSSYSLTASGSLAPYASFSSSAIELSAGGSGTMTLTMSLPKNYTGANDLTLNLISDWVFVDELSFNPTLVAADPEHKVAVSAINLDEDYYFIGDSISGAIVITNTGDYSESFWVECNINGESFKQWTSLNKGASKTISFSSEEIDDIGLIAITVLAYNDDFSSQDSLSVSVNDVTYSFNSHLSSYEIISNDTSVETVDLIITNTGNVVDKYLITSGYSGVVLSNRLLLVDPGDTETVTSSINVPNQFELLDIGFNICSQWSSEDLCEEHSLIMYVFKDTSSSSGVSQVSVDDSKLSASASEGAVYSLSIKNNDYFTNSYSISFQGDFANYMTAYPSGSFTISPGEEESVVVYVSPMPAGIYSTDYTVYENAQELSSGSLDLTVTEELGFGLTGFTIASGGIIGIAGVFILVLFIYFTKRSHKKTDQFKPLQIKKADLGKPKSKDAGQYW